MFLMKFCSCEFKNGAQGNLVSVRLAVLTLKARIKILGPHKNLKV